MGVGIGISAVLIALAYLLGSTPTGYLVGYALQGIDIRQYGSGGTGATNVLRTLGKKPALFVLVVDILKGAIAILIVKLGCAWMVILAAVDRHACRAYGYFRSQPFCLD